MMRVPVERFLMYLFAGRNRLTYFMGVLMLYWGSLFIVKKAKKE